MNTRRSGVLLHPLSLPGPAGCGDLGPGAHAFLRFLADAGQSLWQMLPMGPTGYADSPYQCLSSMAGNPLMISLDLLMEDGLLTQDQLKAPAFSRKRLEYPRLGSWKEAALELAWQRFQATPDHALWDAFRAFYTAEGWWLHDFALFMTLRELHGQACWNQWPAPLAHRQASALEELNQLEHSRVLRHKFHQFLFFRQLERLRAAARELGILLVGDMPIFVAFDSADVWAWRSYFRITEEGQPEVVAGVPPDYFSEDGQRWGNPLYNWDAMRQDDWWWWRSRFHMLMRQCDVIRVDHFRGFEACWEIPGTSPTARVGQWVKTPGRELFTALQRHLPHLRLIAEDLGLITPEVASLRQDFNMPGMKILQFAFFTDSRDPFLPHNYEQACVGYTGTHDNNTMAGFYKEDATPAQQAWMRRYLDFTTEEDLIPRSLDRLWGSSANWVLAPMQDLLGLGAEARVNTPGTTGGNWAWRMGGTWPKAALERQLQDLNTRFNRNLPPREVLD